MKEYIVTEHPYFPYEEPKPQELIRCRDCKYAKKIYIKNLPWLKQWEYSCGYFNTHSVNGDGFCSYAEPVRHGKWIESDEYDEFSGRLYRCSNCNTFVIGDMDNYCPNCGARMDND